MKRFLPLALMLLTLGLAFGLRVYQLDGHSMWSDEGLSLYRAQQNLPTLLSNIIRVGDVDTRDTSPPLYFLALAGFRALAGESAWTLRFFSALWGTLSVGLIFVVGRRLFSTTVGLVAAFLLAVSPFHVFYSQELRNYSLLVGLNLLSVYLLWALTHAAGSRRASWLGLAWVATCAAMVYTHYFALFTLAFEGLALLVLTAWRRVDHRIVWALGASALAAIPLLPFGLSRLRAGPQFDFYAMPPLEILRRGVTAYSIGMVREVGRPWPELLPFLALVGAGLAVGLLTRRWRPATLFTLGYLAVPLALLLAVSTVTPLYNGPRHLLMGLPPFVLLVALALGGLPRRWALLGLPVLVWLTWQSAGMLDRYYFDPDYAHDDVHNAAAYLNERVEPGDVVVLHDQLISFTFNPYYHADAPVTAVPRYASGDVEAAKTELARLAAEHGRVWFVSEPRPRDGFPRDALPDWLSKTLFRASSASFHHLWLDVGVDEYRAAPPVTPGLPAEATALTRRWEGGIELVGYRWRAAPRLGEPLRLTLYWRASQPPRSDGRVSFALVDSAGATWWSAENGFYDRLPMTKWPVGQIVAQDYLFSLPPGLAPVEYSLRLQLRAEDGQTARPAESGPAEGWLAGPAVTLARPAAPVDLPSVLGRRDADARFDGLRLIAYDQPATPPRPGQRWRGALYWRAEQPLTVDAQVQVALVTRGGQTVAETLVPASAPEFLTSAWRPGDLVRTPFTLALPGAAPDGTLRLRVALLGPDGAPLSGRAGLWPGTGDAVDIGPAEVGTWPLVTAPPAVQHPLDAVFGPARLRGYDLDPADGAVRPGGAPLALRLVWQAEARPERNYQVFIHLVDAQGQIRAQVDGVPVNGTRPTDGWRASEVIVDERRLSLPRDLAPGVYSLRLGLYQPPDGARAPASRDGQPLANDQLDLGPVVTVKAGS